MCIHTGLQCAKEVLFNSQKLVDFPVGLVNSVCHLADRQVWVSEENICGNSYHKSSVRQDIFRA